jgi:UDP-N-acetylmuramoyl-L-alanyl-D-glutamate--2,6-diaminopimelate ligase
MDPLIRLQQAGVRRLTTDSRRVAADTAFVALPPAAEGSRDGRDFAVNAIAAGSPLVLGEGVAPAGIEIDQWLELGTARQDYPALAAKLAGEAGQKLRVIGVTGTDGKTSVAWLASELLNALEPNTCARLGTLGAQWSGVDESPGFTTPPASVLHPLMARMVADGVKRLVMEVSSHAIALGRVAAVEFQCGMLTTLARDHLDFHGDVEAYHRTKIDWLDGLSDQAAVVLPEQLESRLSRRSGLRTVGSDGFFLESLSRQSGWTHFRLGDVDRQVVGRTRLLGRLMLDNLALACDLARAEGFGLEAIAAAVEKVAPVPGRFEPVGTHCLVDYAHTPDALAQALTALREHCSGRLIVVFGAGGDRDRGKRPEMAAAVERCADVAIVTTDNPRGEDPRQIIADVVRGFVSAEGGAEHLRGALGWALCGEDDLLFVAGKGAEKTQEIAGERFPFDDRHELRRLMEG